MLTQVAIIGAGPAGMVLAHLLREAGIGVSVIECHTRAYVEARVRAGVLEQGTVDLLERMGLGARLRREGLVHAGTNLAFDGEAFRIDMRALTGGSAITVYGQQQIMRDLFDAAEQRGIGVVWDADHVALHDVEGARPWLTFIRDEAETRIDCDFIAGCDGFHGISRDSIPASLRQIFERVYPFGWLGILADVPPAGHELVYANHERGFALASMRSEARSRYYVQVALDEKPEDWPDERFWDELCLRLGPGIAGQVTRGPVFEKSIAPLRSFVAEPMRHGNLFLAGDAAHIVPPTGAKGMNLAVSDARMLAGALAEFYRTGSMRLLDTYSTRALARVWKAERFSWWFTSLTHRFPEAGGFARRLQKAEFDYIRGSVAAQTALAENYVGLALEDG